MLHANASVYAFAPIWASLARLVSEVADDGAVKARSIDHAVAVAVEVYVWAGRRTGDAIRHGLGAVLAIAWSNAAEPPRQPA